MKWMKSRSCLRNYKLFVAEKFCQKNNQENTMRENDFDIPIARVSYILSGRWVKNRVSNFCE